jgi:hypothetical protein
MLLVEPQFDEKFYRMVSYKRGHAVVKLVEALCYKPEARGFVSRFFN